MKVYAVIPAGGKGIRSGNSTPKQYIRFYGKELLVYTLEIFQKEKQIDAIALSVHPAYIDLVKKLKEKYKLTKLVFFAEAGKERQDSVFNALKILNADKKDIVLVHDGARPLLPGNVLRKALSMAKEKGNAVVCLKAPDTLVKGKDTINKYLNRDEIFYVQTPQIFYYQDLMKAMVFAYKKNFTGTDESILLKKIGKKIYISEGSSLNIKITNNDDILLFKKLIRKIH